MELEKLKSNLESAQIESARIESEMRNLKRQIEAEKMRGVITKDALARLNALSGELIRAGEHEDEAAKRYHAAVKQSEDKAALSVWKKLEDAQRALAEHVVQAETRTATLQNEINDLRCAYDRAARNSRAAENKIAEAGRNYRMRTAQALSAAIAG